MEWYIELSKFAIFRWLVNLIFLHLLAYSFWLICLGPFSRAWALTSRFVWFVYFRGHALPVCLLLADVPISPVHLRPPSPGPLMPLECRCQLPPFHTWPNTAVSPFFYLVELKLGSGIPFSTYLSHLGQSRVCVVPMCHMALPQWPHKGYRLHLEHLPVKSPCCSRILNSTCHV